MPINTAMPTTTKRAVRREELTDPRGGDGAKDRSQQEAGADHDARDHREADGGLGPRGECGERAGVVRVLGSGRRGGREQWQDRQDRDHSDVLEEQDGEGRLSTFARLQPAFGQALQDDRGRGQRECQTDDQRAAPIEAEREGGAHHGRGGEGHLQTTEPEDRSSESPQLAGSEFQSHEEEHDHHPELGDVHGLLGVADEV